MIRERERCIVKHLEMALDNIKQIWQDDISKEYVIFVESTENELHQIGGKCFQINEQLEKILEKCASVEEFIEEDSENSMPRIRVRKR